MEGLRGALSEHELAQELLYRYWRAGWVFGDKLVLWCNAAEELERDAPCEYLQWLLQTYPQLSTDAP